MGKFASSRTIVGPFALAAVFCVGAHLLSSKEVPDSMKNDGTSPLILMSSSPSRCVARVGDIVIAGFIVRNVTSEPIKLLGANASCSCTVVRRDFPFEIAPGDSERIDVQVKVGRPDASGKFTKSAVLLVNHKGKVPELTIVASVLGSSNSP